MERFRNRIHPFDILFDQDTSVIHEPLSKRYKLLKGAIRGCLDKGAVKVGDTGITCAVISPFQDDIAGNESQVAWRQNLERSWNKTIRTLLQRSAIACEHKITAKRASSSNCSIHRGFQENAEVIG